MAKRINTPFVTAVAAVCFVGFLAVIGMSALKNRFFVRPPEEIVKEERLLAKKLVAQGRYNEAGDTITRAWFRDKNNKEVCLERGDILMYLTDEIGHEAIDMARKSWENALGIDSHYKPALTRILDSYVDQMELAPSADTCGHLADTARRILKFDSDPRAKSYLQIAMIYEWILEGKAKTEPEIETMFANMRALLKDDPSNAEVLFYMVRGKVFAASDALSAGRSDEGRKDLDEARAALDKATQAFPKNAALNFRAFQGYVALADTERDMARLPNPTVGLKTDSPRDLANKISSRLFHLTPTAAERDLAAAEAVLRRARETVKDDDERYGDFQYVAAEWARRNDHADEAEAILRKYHKEHSTDQLARLALCHVLAMTGDAAKRDEAIRILEQPVRRIGQPGLRKLTLRELESQTVLDLTTLRVALYPTVEPARRALLMAQIEEGYNKVRAIAVSNAIPVLRLEGLISQLKGQNVDAVNTLSKALALLNKAEPNNPIKYNLMFQLATVERLAGQNRSAEVHLKELVERFEKYDPARLQLAECYLEDRNTAEAARHIEILDLHLHDPQQTAHLSTQEMLRLKLNLAQQMERKDDVKAMYAQLLEGTFEEKLTKAQIAGTLKDFDETIRLLKEMEAMKPDQSAITVAIYQAFIRKGTKSDRDIARQYLEAAIKKNPDDKQLKIIQREAEHPMPSQPDRIAIKLQALNGNPLMVEIAAGLDALAQQNYAEAIKRARAADNIRPDDPATWDLKFQIYKEQQNWDAINDAVTNLSRLDADHANGRMYRWTVAMARGNYAEAIRVAKDLTSDRGNFGQSWMLLAEAMQANGEFHEALQYYEAALARQTTNVDAYKGMAICWENLSQRDRARDVVMEGVRKFPDDPTLRETLLRFEATGNPPSVVPKRRKLLDQNPDDPENFINLSAACVRAGEWIYPSDPKQARGFIDEALDVLTRGAGKFPDDLRVNRELANVLRSIGRFDDGVKVLRAVAETPKWKGKPDPLLFLADYYTRARRLKEADETYRQAWALTRNLSVEIELRLAGFLHQQGKYDEALTVLKANEHDPRIVLQTLQVHIAARHTAQARKGLDEALKADPENPDLLNLDAGVWIDMLDYVQARKVLNHVLSIDPRNDVALFFQAMVELRDPITSDLKLARDNLALIVNRNPRNMQFKLLYVDSLIRINDLDLASVELDGAVRLDPFNREIRLKLLDMQIRLKKWPQFEQTVLFGEQNPAISDAIWYRAHAYGYAAQKRYPEAIDSIQQAISMDKTNNPAYQRDYLIILLASENFEGVIRLTDQWMSANHHEWWIYHLRALARVGLGKPVEAMEQFDKAMKAADDIKNPDAWEQVLSSMAEVNVDAALKRVAAHLEEAKKNPIPLDVERWQLHSVSLHMRKQDWAGAKRDLEGLILKRHQLRRDQRLSTVRFAAECYQATGDNDKAEAFYAEWLKEAPNDPTALNNFACLLAENPAQLKRARTYSQKAYELGTKYNNPDPMINDTHGWILSQLSGTYANDGLDILEKLVNAHGEMVDAHYHLAQAYLKRNRKDDAVKELTAALNELSKNEAKKMPARPQLKAKIQETLDKAKKAPAGKAGV